MTIPAEVYAALSPDERIRAAVAAIARDDDAELKTLAETCPRKTYRMIDAAFGEGMERLKMLTLAVESDLQGVALDFYIAAHGTDPDEIRAAIAVAASIEAAYCAILSEKGLDRDEVVKFGPARHSAVHKMLTLSTGREIPELVESRLALMREYLTT
ncbi:MAG: hypothetical protein Q8Q59_07740 [Luteolibacter sp.]|jgi:hypothetical protein|nr:hypothetical protein [Luteolibacter sp.]